MTPCTIRPITAEDRSAWDTLWTDYLNYYKSSVPHAVYDTTFARFFSDDAYEPRCHLAIQGEAPVGLVHFFQHRHCWHTENVIYLQDLFVDPAARGTGAGKALIQSVYDTADTNGTPIVYWMTTDDNPARKLYDQVATRTNFVKYQR